MDNFRLNANRCSFSKGLGEVYAYEFTLLENAVFVIVDSQVSSFEKEILVDQRTEPYQRDSVLAKCEVAPLGWILGGQSDTPWVASGEMKIQVANSIRVTVLYPWTEQDATSLLRHVVEWNERAFCLT